MDDKEDMIIDKILEELDLEEDELDELEDWDPVLLAKGKRISELTVDEFRDILREEISKSLPIYAVPQYEGVKIPRTPGELNDNYEFNITDHTVLKSDKFPGWGPVTKKFDNP